MNDNLEKDIISVIVPIYMVETYLEQCIESLINQTYQNLEIILVDDGSTDACGQICDTWAERDSRIIVIHQENGGLSNARNTGIRHSTGCYLMFVDSDDYVEKDYVRNLYQGIVEHRADVATCGFSIFSEDGQQKNVTLPKVEDNVMNKLDAFLELENVGERRMAFTVVWNKIYKRELWEDLRFPEGVLCEDAFVMPLVYERCRKVAIVCESLYIYRRRKGSITAEQNENLVKAQLDFYEEREKIYRRIGVRELLIMQQVHLYGMYDCFEMLDSTKRKTVQEKLRKYFFSYQYATKVSVNRRIKDLLAIVNINLYQKFVNIILKMHRT